MQQVCQRDVDGRAKHDQDQDRKAGVDEQLHERLVLVLLGAVGERSCERRHSQRALYAHRILPDISHLSEAAAWDVVRLGLGPVIASHANSRAVCAHTRNLSDDLFCAIRDSGGVVGLNLYTDFLGGTDTDAVVRHIEHLLDLGGTETLALGGDLDGCDALGGGVTGIQDYPKLYAALAARGYDEPLLNALFSGNWLRVLSDK